MGVASVTRLHGGPLAVELADTVRELARRVETAYAAQTYTLKERRAEEAKLLLDVLTQIRPAMQAIAAKLPGFDAEYRGLVVDEFRGRKLVVTLNPDGPLVGTTGLFALDDENPPAILGCNEAVTQFRLAAIVSSLANAMEKHAAGRRESVVKLARETRRLRALSTLLTVTDDAFVEVDRG